MAAPEYVPRPKDEKPRVYESPPWRGESWMADRPAELPGRQPHGPRLGHPGPDQGFAWVLAERFRGRLVLHAGEREDDALAGAVAVALKRAAMLGRAPVIHDLTVALTVWGFLDQADPELVRVRTPLFEEVANPHHYMELRRVADLVAPSVLRMTPAEVAAQARADWRSLFPRRAAAAS
ncbi:MAG: hypothetical protein MUF83_03595 [Acidimicrobiales bacterium]|jgi:hypothetical protein|nr:hypothetical protein [Acidimicrobiales bacterium]